LQEEEPEARTAVDLRWVVDATPRAAVVCDLEGTVLLWNRQAEALYGWTEDEVVGRPVLDLIVGPAERDESAAIIDQVLEGRTWQGEVTARRKDGTPLQVWVAGTPVRDADGQVVGVLGAAEDLADRRRVERITAQLSERLQVALEAGGLGTFEWYRADGRVIWDERMAALFGLERHEFAGTEDAWIARVHPDDRDRVVAAVDESIGSQSEFNVDHRVVWPDGTERWLRGAGHVTTDSEGKPAGLIGVATDITDERRSRDELQRLTIEALEAADRERMGAERLAFLGRINEALASSRDRETVMRSVVAASVPRLGDWCVISVLRGGGDPVPDIEIAHVDPAMVSYAHQVLDRYPYDPSGAAGVAHVIRTGEPEFWPQVTEEDLAKIPLSADQREVLERLELRSVITVPLTKRGRVLGALQFVRSDESRLYTQDDFALAQVMAARIASSLDNLRLVDEQIRFSRTLQASLLPKALPEVPGVDIAVRYWAKGEGVQVGGDFYDLFEVRDGLWAFVLGDVCGTGAPAAATAGLIRHTLAASAWHGDGPVEVLHSLNRTMRNRGAGPFCTVLYGTVEVVPAGLELTVVCGGHPLPVLVEGAGGAATFGQPGTLIGALEQLDLTPVRRVLQPGDTLVAYTDGATDLPHPHALSEVDVTGLVQGAAAGSEHADDVADGIHRALDRILPIEQRNDDIALLVLRATG
jgi:PAS domain S-box-containing protein